jgi:3-hydroxyisobutyrate dehydrogenase
MVQRVGWIGTGRMGVAMAANLARSGVRLTAWNRTAAKAEPLTAFGATVAGSLADLRGNEVVFTMVSTAADLNGVLFDDGGLLAGAGSLPEVLVDCSTIAMVDSAEVRRRCDDLGVAFLASPVSGNGKVVRSGGLTLVASGPEPVFERVRPLLEAIGASATYAGEGETARLVKIAHNLMLGVVTQCMAEITVLAEKGGVSRHAFLEFLNNSVMGSAFTRYKTPAFVHLDYTPTFTPLLLRKDFDLGLAAARELDVPMPLAALTAELVQASVGSGRTEEDFAILLDLQAAASGMTLKPEDVSVDDGLTVDPELGFS